MNQRSYNDSLPLAQRRALWRISCALLVCFLLAACNPGREQPQPTPTSPPASEAPEQTETSGEDVAVPAGNTDNAETAGNTGTASGEPADQTTSQAPAQSTLTGELVLWHSWAGAEGDALAAVLQDFQARYPGVQIDTLFVAHDDLLQSYAESVLAGGGPSLIIAPNWWLADMVFLQLVTAFEPELPQATVDGLFPATVDSMRWNGTLYGLPVLATVPAVYVNTQLHNEPLPPTLAEWTALAQSSPELGIGLYANVYHLAWGLPAHGAELFDGQGRVILHESTGTTEFLTWLATLNAIDGSYVDQDYGMLLERFKNGEFAFFVDGPWSLADLSAALDGAITVAPLPHGPVRDAVPWLYADGLFLSPNTDDDTRRLASLFGQHLTSSASGAHFAQSGTLLPANRNVTIPPENPLAGFYAQAETAAAMPTRQEMDAVWGYGGDMIIRAILGNEEINAIVAETATLINEANGR